MDRSPPGSSVHRILQARILKWVAISSSRGSFWPRNWNWISLLKVKVKSLSRVWLFATPWTVAYQAPSLHGILHARVLEWVTSTPGDLPNPGIELQSPTFQADSLTSEPPGKQSPELTGRLFTTSTTLEALSYLQVGKNKCYKWFKYKVMFDKTKSLQFIKKEGLREGAHKALIWCCLKWCVIKLKVLYGGEEFYANTSLPELDKHYTIYWAEAH